MEFKELFSKSMINRILVLQHIFKLKINPFLPFKFGSCYISEYNKISRIKNQLRILVMAVLRIEF
jgi:hypothetical protein